MGRRMDKFWSIGPYNFEYHTDTGYLSCTLGQTGISTRNVPKENVPAAKVVSVQVVLEATNTIKFRAFEFLKDLMA